jgi:hypothetical protein
MKKIMMTLAAVLVSVAASAQVYVGGTVGFQTSKPNGDGAKSATKFQINPEVGYNISDNFAVGINIGFSSEKGVWNEPAQGFGYGREGDEASTKFKVAPYARYTYAKLGIVDLFLDGQFSFATVKDSHNELGIHIIPGVAVNASDNIAFVAKLGEGLGWSMYKAKEGDGKANKFGVDFDTLTALQFGLYFKF